MCCTRDLVAGMATCGTRRGSAGGPVVHDKPAFLVTTTHDGVSDPTGVFTDLHRVWYGMVEVCEERTSPDRAEASGSSFE